MVRFLVETKHAAALGLHTAVSDILPWEAWEKGIIIVPKGTRRFTKGTTTRSYPRALRKHARKKKNLFVHQKIQTFNKKGFIREHRKESM